MNSEVEKYVEEAKNSGMADDGIRRELFSAGWSIGEINTAINNYRKNHNIQPIPPRPHPSVTGFPQESRYHYKDSSVTSYHVDDFKSGNIHVGNPDFDRKKKISKVFNAIIFTGIMAVCLIAIGLSAYVVIIPNLRKTLPFRTEAFLTDFVNSLSGISSVSYTAGVAVATEKRNPAFKSLKEAFPEYAPKEGSDIFSYSDKDEHFLTTMMRDQELYAAVLPKDMKAELSVDGDVSKNANDEFKPFGHLGLSGSFNTPDFSMNGDIEFVTKDGVVYGRINHMPSFFIFNFDKLKGKWVKMSSIRNTATSKTSSSLTDQEKNSLINDLRKIPAVADEVGLFSVIGAPTAEVLDGVKTYRYDLKLNSSKFLEFYDKLTPILRSATPKSELAYFDEQTIKQRKQISDPIFVKLLDYSQGNLSSGTYPVSIWVSVKERLPVKIVFSGTAVPEKYTQAMDNTGKMVTQENQQISIKGMVRLENINEKVEVSAPAEFITMEEAQKLMGLGSVTPSSKVPKTSTKLK